ncbi:hypothetical protein ACUOFC_66780, partial [Escherichia sp. TWPC-MK]
MDTRVLQEQRLEAIAQIKEAQSAVAAAQALLEQRQSETRAAQSLVNQRQATALCASLICAMASSRCSCNTRVSI